MIFLNIVILIVGFVALVKGADIFVDGSANLARRFRVPSLIIGLTIVALGTSMPELAVSTTAAIQGANEIALSNVVGSNIFNLLVVLGICAVINPVPVDKAVLRRDFPLNIVTTLLVLIVIAFPGIIGGTFSLLGMDNIAGIVSRPLAIILLVLFITYIVYLIYDAKKHPVHEEETQIPSLLKSILFIVIGLILIIAGGKAVVYASQEIALAAGMSETLIGLTIVAIGTSLPELVTSIVAARKGETSLAVGNVIGSNIFNLLFILGVSAAIHPVSVNMASIYDFLILSAVTVLSFIFALSGKKIHRAEGICMLAIYAASTCFAIIR